MTVDKLLLTVKAPDEALIIKDIEALTRYCMASKNLIVAMLSVAFVDCENDITIGEIHYCSISHYL